MRSHQTVARVIIGIAAAALAVVVALSAAEAVTEVGVATISPERAAALAVNTLEAVEGGYDVRNPTLRASFSAGGLELRPRGSDLQWSWRFTRLEPGGKAGIQFVAPANPEPGLVRYQRGFLDEEYELEADGIEQRFVLHQPPPGGADLILEGAVSCRAELRAAGGGWEWRGGRGVVRLGPATVVDASGATLPSSLEVSATTTRLVSAGEALIGAAYPVTVTTEIRSYSLRISDMGGTGDPVYGAICSDAAYNSTTNQYLVVWHADETGSGLVDGEFEIYGQRIDAATGQELGANDFRISDMGGTGNPDFAGAWPGVAYNSTDNQYLVVWYGDDNVNGLVDDEYEVFGQRLDAMGAALGSNDFRISDMGDDGDPTYSAGVPAVAYNSTDDQYLVVWDGDTNSYLFVDEEYEIFGQLLDATTGAEIGTNDFRISGMGGTGDPDFDARSPDAAYNGGDNEYLVVWHGDDDVGGLVDDEKEIFGQRLDAATGIAVGAEDFRISDMGGTGAPSYLGDHPALAFNSGDNEYLVVWRGDDNIGGLVDGEMEVFGQRLLADGSETGANDFRISDLGGTGTPDFGVAFPNVSYSIADRQYLVVWEGDDTTGGLVEGEIEIFGQLLDAGTGEELGANDFRVSEMGGTGSPAYDAAWAALAPGGSAGEYLVVWRGDDNTGGLVDDEFEIFGKLLGILPFEDGFESGDTSAWSTTVP